MNPRPQALQITSDARLQIEWSDGSQLQYPIRTLRDQCPCATCREKRKEPESPDTNLLPIVSPEQMVELAITKMWPVGSYAYGIEFSDGHNTGIYTYEYLRALGEEAA